ncbi:MAG: radical SAM family heme chaperone HemW [Sphingobacteriales bacterium]|nr:radical SAM family heme chaperone HemW [Sphingobacteriales bacterium]OJY92603.1 MAG: coproporphyrinogen III oxidase [Sphingobacteriales bacterium 44-15]
MAGIYVHIPFCRQACLYCNFHFSTLLKQKNDLIDALLKEIIRTTTFAGNETIATVYLGGGTPSLLETKELNAIFNTLHSKFSIASDAEITLEANPDDISPGKLRMWKQTGINRLSIGIQSFFEEDLKWMNRAHNAQQAMRCISEAQDAGFSNLSIDLIYGTPTLPDDHWQRNVEKVTGLGVPHISCYALTVEPKTALHQLIHKHKMQDTDPEQQARQFLQLIQWLTGAGYEHYEISNFSLPGRRSRHNTSYWQGKPYYGFGPSAHSFNGIDTRSWNIANNALYIKSIREEVLPVEKEVLTETQKINEYIMTSLRTMEGIDLDLVQLKFGEHMAGNVKKKAGRFSQERIFIANDFIRLTDAGKLFADGIAAELFED